MEVLVPLGAAAASLVGVGVLGLFGRDSNDDGGLSRIARRLDAREDPDAVERKLDALDRAIDTLIADADLDRHVSNPPAADASSVEKAEALSRAVERDRLSVGPAATAGSEGETGGTVASAAAAVKSDASPSSPAARRLLDATAAPARADRGELTDLLERAVGALDTQRELERALGDVSEGDEFAPSEARRVRNRLDHPDNAVTAGVRRLAAKAEESHATAENRETEYERIADATDTLTESATEATDLDVGPNSGRPVAERLGVVADAVNRDELGFGAGGSGRVPAAAAEVRRSRNPESAIAKRLLDRLASPKLGDVEAALDTAAEQLDAATTTHSIVSDLDRDSVRSLADAVADRLDD
ncbi:hypothetical protein [Halorussus amylolyticus]|uniref:hypothetical protein n=1 Tax=Halorussus amylolyticus TaxID=1126242 RepID=UPI00138ED36F|nr:hypothetical protein [Halorussus amylolyticus]